MKHIYAFTDEELQELVNDSTARVFVKKSVLHISLHAHHFADLKQSLCEIFDESINRFKPELNGIILSYRNIKVLNSIGKIINDDSKVNTKVQADYYVFSPEVGSVLTGIVIKKSNDHVGCLVHKLFNVSIPRPEEGSWEGESVELGQQISFVVEYMDFDLSLPYIRGRLQDADLLPGWMEGATKKKRKKKKSKKSAEEEDHIDEPAKEFADKGEDSEELQPSKKKKKKKERKGKESAEKLQDTFSDVEQEAISENVSYEANISTDLSDFSVLASSTQREELSPKKKKKKRKSKDLENADTEQNDGEINFNEISQELNSSYVDEFEAADEIPMKKKHKKKKLHPNADFMVIDNIEDAEKKKRKKQKKHKHHDIEEGEENCEKDVEKPTTSSPRGLLENVWQKYNEDALKNTQASHQNKVTSPGKTKKLHKLDVNHIGNTVKVHLSSEDENAKETECHPPLAGASVVDPNKGSLKRKVSATGEDRISVPKKRRSVGFSEEVEIKTISPIRDHADVDEETFTQITPGADTSSTSSSPIGGATLSSSFNSYLYSGANMANSLDRKRRRISTVFDDIVAPKLSLNNRSPTHHIIQSHSQPEIRDKGTAVEQEDDSSELSSPSNSEKEKGRSPERKLGDNQPVSKETLFVSPPKPLTQVESVSKESQTASLNKANEKLNTSAANVSTDFNSSINTFELPDISHLIARLKAGENPVSPKQEKSPKSTKAVTKEKKTKAEDKKVKAISAKSKQKGHKKEEKEKDKDNDIAKGKEAERSPGLISPSNSQKKNSETVDSAPLFQGKSGVKSPETLLSPPKPLTQVESTSKDSQCASFNKANEKLNNSGPNVSGDNKSNVDTFEAPNISQLIARLKAGENPFAPKQEKSPKSNKAVNKKKKTKSENKEVKVVSAKNKHKGHKKDKNKKEKDKDKKKKEDKSKKGDKEKKAIKGGVDELTELSNKLLHNFLKKQTGS